MSIKIPLAPLFLRGKFNASLSKREDERDLLNMDSERIPRSLLRGLASELQ